MNFNNLRVPAAHLLGAGNTLRLYGGESLFSNQDQTMFVRRQTDFDFEATTCVTLPFEQFQQFAGLIYRYDEAHQYLLKFAYDERIGSHTLGIMTVKGGEYTAPLSGKEIPVEGDTVWLRVTGHGTTARFSYSADGNTFTDIDYEIDSTILSDDYVFGFTGAFVGMAAYDLYDHTSYADFTHFSYKVL